MEIDKGLMRHWQMLVEDECVGERYERDDVLMRRKRDFGHSEENKAEANRWAERLMESPSESVRVLLKLVELVMLFKFDFAKELDRYCKELKNKSANGELGFSPDVAEAVRKFVFYSRNPFDHDRRGDEDVYESSGNLPE